MYRRAVLWLVLLLILPCESARAQSLTISAALEVSQNYQPNRWQPVRVELRNDSDQPVEGRVSLPLNDPAAPATMQLPLSVQPHTRTTATLWGYFPVVRPTPQQKKRGEIPPLATAEWRSADGAMLARSQVLGFPLTSPTSDEIAADTGEMIL